jgi:hypothetical protein
MTRPGQALRVLTWPSSFLELYQCLNDCFEDQQSKLVSHGVPDDRVEIFGSDTGMLSH